MNLRNRGTCRGDAGEKGSVISGLNGPKTDCGSPKASKKRTAEAALRCRGDQKRLASAAGTGGGSGGCSWLRELLESRLEMPGSMEELETLPKLQNSGGLPEKEMEIAGLGRNVHHRRSSSCCVTGVRLEEAVEHTGERSRMPEKKQVGEVCCRVHGEEEVVCIFVFIGPIISCHLI